MTIDIVKDVISKLKFDKAARPSGVLTEMVRAAGDAGANMILNLAIAIIRYGEVPADWEQSYNSSAFKRERVICSGPRHFKRIKLTMQAIKVTERIADSFIRQVVTIDESQAENNTCNLFFSSRAADEIYNGKQTYLYCFRGHREGVRLSISESDLVGNEKASR